MKKLHIADKTFQSRIFLGTGKFSSSEALKSAIKSSGTELVTAALKRVNPENPSDDILSAIGDSATIMLNTSGARDADEALKLAKARADATVAVLVEKGVPIERIRSFSKIAESDTADSQSVSFQVSQFPY